MKQARLPHARIADDSNDLTTPRSDLLDRAFHLVEFRLAADELGQSPSRCGFQPGPQRTKLDDFVGDDRLADAFDFARGQLSELEEAFTQLSSLIADDHRSRRRQRLQPRSQTGWMSDRRILDARIVGPHAADHHLSGVHPNAYEDRQAARLAQ